MLRINCGIKALADIFNELKIAYDYNFLLATSKSMLNEITFGSLYKVCSVLDILALIKELNRSDFNFERCTFRSVDELEKILREKITTRGKVLFPYYTCQGDECGAVATNSDKLTLDMKHGHWCAMMRMNETNHIFTAQPAGSGSSCRDFFLSNQLLNRIKVDWGKYNKCRITIPSGQLGSVPRCNSKNCRLLGDEPFTCIFSSDLSGELFVIGAP